jgi:hypothetical protein
MWRVGFCDRLMFSLGGFCLDFVTRSGNDEFSHS